MTPLPPPPDPAADPLARAARLAERSHRLGLRDRISPARGLMSLGMLGWLVVVPMLAGLFLGRWIDRTIGHGIMMTAALLFAGAGLGWWLAWRHMRES